LKKRHIFRKILFVIALFVFCFAAFKIIAGQLAYKEGRDEYEHIREIAEKEPEDPADPGSGIDWSALRQINPDLIGWIRFKEPAVINYPVVQGKDNKVYLKKSFGKNFVKAGTIFMNYANDPKFGDSSTIIYGHNMNDGSMFASLKKYKDKAFFSFENCALYRRYTRIPNVPPQNHICDLLYVANYYGMTFNNVTELELAFDSTYNYIRTARNWIKDTENFDLYINGKKVKDAELLAGYGEYYARNRSKLSATPTLYFSQKKDTDMKMRVYDKSKELEENSPQKAEQVKEWFGWDDMSQLYRIEVVLHNTNVRDFFDRCREQLPDEWTEYNNVLNLLCVPEFRLAMFLDSADRLIYFKHRRTRKKVSLVEVA
jgi:SrtB family sortase